jgi:hypothetical protein
MSALPLKLLVPSGRRTLYALRAAGDTGVTNGALCQPSVGGNRFGARIHELRKHGCVIYRAELRPGRYRYWLVEDVFESPRTVVRAHDQTEPQLDLLPEAA